MVEKMGPRGHLVGINISIWSSLVGRNISVLLQQYLEESHAR